MKLVPSPGSYTNETLTERVRQLIQTAIVEGTIEEGQAITEMEIAESLQVSRTPIREAFRLLAAQGYLTILPRKGVYVRQISVTELQEMYAVRIELESMAMRLAASSNPEEVVARLSRSLDTQSQCIHRSDVVGYIQENIKFHEVFSDLCGNGYLKSLVKAIEDHTLRYRVLSLRTLPGRMEVSYKDHVFIRDFIREGKLTIAEQVLREHILASRAQLEQRLKQKVVKQGNRHDGTS
ncbi:GntR family transcriptional regulator [Alicyclobacillus mengziensis]|uniref:GntR family transcriptional regulator n=1 Tax=Alicyclobacillus mengziensis TaxID=2931921 RepID=A0A9X7W2T9_9BACL|nr:GntR family transcriptional regulator [Alicyclobacillus mengziensis]QSO49345.1 GntR family transcriptional regulator [Alicyclobacillus mengziensis]